MAFKRSAVRLRLAPPLNEARRLLLPGLFAFWASAALADETPVWRQVAFGQTLADLDRVLAGRIQPIPRRDYGPMVAERMIRGETVGGVTFDLFLQTDPATGRLVQLLY